MDVDGVGNVSVHGPDIVPCGDSASFYSAVQGFLEIHRGWIAWTSL